MGNYQGAIKSNYFHVKNEDEDDFMEFMSRVITYDDASLEVTVDHDKNGNLLFGFFSDGPILGLALYDDEEDDTSDEYTAFILGLQEFVADDDAIIIMEIGVDETSDITAGATIITSSGSDYIDLRNVATDRAFDLLLRP